MEVFYTYFNKPGSSDFTRLKELFEYSLKKHNPKLKITAHVSEYPAERKPSERSAHLENIHKLKIWNEKVQKARGALLLVDCDLLILDDLSEIQKYDADIVFTDRDMKFSTIRFNAGVIFVRPTKEAKQFFQKWCDISENDFDIENDFWKQICRQAKGATQSTLTYMVDNNICQNTKLKFIPCDIWNCAAADWSRFSDKTKILHVKSELRKWFLMRATEQQMEEKYNGHLINILNKYEAELHGNR